VGDDRATHAGLGKAHPRERRGTSAGGRESIQQDSYGEAWVQTRA
jgi:hypothetical protein